MVKDSDILRVQFRSSPTAGFIPVSVAEVQQAVIDGDSVMADSPFPGGGKIIFCLDEDGKIAMYDPECSEATEDCPCLICACDSVRECLQTVWDEIGHDLDAKMGDMSP